ncbi:hypothetical protein DFJ74DRAFT_331220 [Hyaloraphidium curvatum]|nr:hypothetical protein DFJ74DRAFT_331220 [Hyaloraphidium curvatum]
MSRKRDRTDVEGKRDRWKEQEAPSEEEQQMQRLEKLLTAGRSFLDPELLKGVKAFCRASDTNLRLVFDAALLHLGKPHAQIRFSALQLYDELFSRSHLFRQLTAENYVPITNLALGINGEKLPPPEKWAKRAKTLGLVLVKEWSDRFGPGYKQLEIGLEQVRSLLGLDSFPTRADVADMEFAATREQREADARIAGRRLKEYRDALGRIEEATPLMKETLQTMKSCLAILIPADPLFAPSAVGNGVNQEDDHALLKDFSQAHGLGSTRYTLDIDLEEVRRLGKVAEDEENEAVFENLRDAAKLAGKHLKLLSSWLSIVQKADVADQRERERVIRTLLDRSAAIRTCLDRATALLETRPDEEGEHFEEVAAKGTGVSEFAVAAQVAEAAEATRRDKDVESAPQSASTETRVQARRPEDGRADPGKERQIRSLADPKLASLLKEAPVIEYDQDLDLWDVTEKQFDQTGLRGCLVCRSRVALTDGFAGRAHRFLGEQQEDHFLSQDTLDQMRKRAVYLKPQDPGKLPACGAPLPRGGLCQRRDQSACPIHGPIVPRDEEGVPLNPADVKDDGKQPWEAIEEDVLRNAGLQDPRTRKGRRQGGEPSQLVDLRKSKDTVQNRLRKVVDDPKAKRSIRAAFAEEAAYSYRDRNAFSWH